MAEHSAEGKAQRQRTEDRVRKSECGMRKPEWPSIAQRAKTEDGGQSSEVGMRNAEVGNWKKGANEKLKR
jgi:hypothetical protein